MKLHKIGCILAGLGILGAAAAVAVVLPMYFARDGGRPEEALEYVEQIRGAELGFEAGMGAPLAIPIPAPRPLSSLDGHTASFGWDQPGFNELGWWPSESDMFGTYWVELDPTGADFTVHGAIRVDGQLQHYTATRELPAERSFNPP